MVSPSKSSRPQSLSLSHLAVEALQCIHAIVVLLEGRVGPEEVPVECVDHQAEVTHTKILVFRLSFAIHNLWAVMILFNLIRWS